MLLSLQVSSVSKPEALTNDEYCSKFARSNDHLIIHRSNDHFIVNSLVVLVTADSEIIKFK